MVIEKTDPKLRDKLPHGSDLLHDPHLNKGTAFTEAERDALGLRGLLPPHIFTQTQQVMRVMENVRRKADPLEKYIFMTGLQDRNERLFYRVVQENLEELVPILYTPTVGQACQEYAHILRRPRGLFISALDKGRIESLLHNWPEKDVRVIVVTDGERILGLGDLGANGMGIPVGKLALYTACAGVDPSKTLPITLDIGTENETFMRDPLYIGLPQRRLRGEAYDQFVDEFVTAVQKVFPKAVIQFEDFGNSNAFRLLAKYRDKVRTFNDDIQGTASVTLAGLLSALQMSGKKLADQTLLFLGAGEAGIGIGDLVVSAMVKAGLTTEEARLRCWFVDSHGLVVKSRTDLQTHKLPYAHDYPFLATLQEAVENLKPTAIIGVSGQPRTFTRPIVEMMARFNEHPIVFALSNPTSKSECTAEEAYEWSEGRAIFASGSPFPTHTYRGKTFVPGQANNAYVFPGVGLGIVASESRVVVDEMFEAAARALVDMVTDEDYAVGRIYPSLTRIREVSARIACAVAEVAFAQRLTEMKRPSDLMGYIQELMYDPTYLEYA